MNANTLISIITPLYNAEKFVAETINSVLNQTYSCWEMILVDDGSTDNSYNIVNEYCKKDSRITLYKRDRLPKGPSTSRNIGVAKSKGEYLIFLDADDLLLPKCLENRLKAFQDNINLDFLVFQMNMLSDNEEFNGRFLTHESQNYLYDFIAAQQFPWTVTCPIWKAHFFKEQLNGFNEVFLRFEDPELHIRALLKNHVQYKVYIGSEYLDCSYRFFKNKINLTAALSAFKQYLSAICDMIDLKENKEEYQLPLQHLYNQVVLFYSVHPNLNIRENINLMNELNKSFFLKKIIDKELYRKTMFFVSYIKYGLYKLRIINSLLLQAGIDHFYGFRIP